MRLTIYILIIGCAILPILLPKKWYLRPISFLILLTLIVFHLMGLQTSARLATLKEAEITGLSPSKEWLDGANKTRLMVQEQQITGILLFGALLLLAMKNNG